jgi:hypothetical protein
MAGVWREASIPWQGKDHVFTPSMLLIRSIERGDGISPICIIELIYGANMGKPQLGSMAWLVATVMRQAGADLSEDDIYAGFMENDKDCFKLYRDVIDAISPTQKKKAAPEK